MKRILLAIGIGALAIAIAIPVLGHGPKGGWQGHKSSGGGPDYCWGRDGGFKNLTDDQRKQLEAAAQKFHDGTAQLKKELWTKQGELQSLMNTSDPDPEKAKALQKELNELAGKMAEARLAFQLEARKIAPEGSYQGGYGKGKGWGRHGRGGMRGYGPGPGYGPKGGYSSRGGYGPGSCWR